MENVFYCLNGCTPEISEHEIIKIIFNTIIFVIVFS